MQSKVASPFNIDSTAEEVIGSIDLTGKLAVITGGSTGIGKETARVLAEAGADLFVGARSREKLESAREEISSSKKGAVNIAELDLMEPASADAFADAVLALGRPVDLLINNAGVMAPPLSRNSLGMESQFATNYVGHAILTSRLAPALLQAEEPRLISLASSGHHASPVDLDDLNYEQREYHKWKAYGQSKTANVYLALKVAKALGEKGVTALAVHPGYIMTELQRYLPEEEMAAVLATTSEKAAKSGSEQIGPAMKTIPQGAATTVWAATSPDLVGKGPLYLENCEVASVIAAPNMVSGVLPYALDTSLAEQLWCKTEALLGRSLPL